MGRGIFLFLVVKMLQSVFGFKMLSKLFNPKIIWNMPLIYQTIRHHIWQHFIPNRSWRHLKNIWNSFEPKRKCFHNTQYILGSELTLCFEYIRFMKMSAKTLFWHIWTRKSKCLPLLSSGNYVAYYEKRWGCFWGKLKM